MHCAARAPCLGAPVNSALDRVPLQSRHFCSIEQPNSRNSRTAMNAAERRCLAGRPASQQQTARPFAWRASVIRAMRRAASPPRASLIVCNRCAQVERPLATTEALTSFGVRGLRGRPHLANAFASRRHSGRHASSVGLVLPRNAGSGRLRQLAAFLARRCHSVCLPRYTGPSVSSQLLPRPNARSNKSFNRTRRGKPPWPRGAEVHDAPRGQGALPRRAG